MNDDSVKDSEKNPLADTFKKEKILLSKMIFHQATPAHGKKLRGVGITRRNKSSTKKADKLAKKQRRINHARKNQKFHKHGSKQRK